ncbi:carboxylesterase family protein [Corynebacterium cystitidis]|uniref:Carboxylic ester hydrolase n=1 Tax=Corynebacterium cystitidis DSM 20524 TaxID=1121357 RepID=A0A1H9W693_9CORY|nr:carboxylesterase family protein [Corynebacterium cystitidis]WJY83214.1 Carboxylesterase [Corynebacterium cystitidis DSM 20524]SES29197.1 Carboxylesterase type B [Corynebacterium cystitidis DSM 20524]SNV67659.1 carboxylesterase [Corynebacterium cystitidis]
MHTAEVTCPAGTIIGRSDGTVDIFHSVPYSHISSDFADAEPAPRGLFIDTTAPQPDTIALTITRPASANDSDDLPVIAYIHGGRFEHGTHEDPRAAGYANATQGIIQVQIGYRIRFEGFARFHDDEPNHYRGIDDCALALEWIQHNIESFGGDPTNVTLVGQSAGATAALWLTRRDHYRGAFRRVLAMSPSFPRASYEQRRPSVQAAFFGMVVTRHNLEKTSKARRKAAYKRYRTRHILDIALGPAPLTPRDMAEVDVVVSSTRDEFYTQAFAAQADRLGQGAAMVRAIGPAMGLKRDTASYWLDHARAIDPKHLAGRFVGDASVRRWVDHVAEHAPGRVWQMELVDDAVTPAYHSRDIRPMFGNNPYVAGDGLNGWLVHYARTGAPGWPFYDATGARLVRRVNLSGKNDTETKNPLGYIRDSFTDLPPEV